MQGGEISAPGVEFYYGVISEAPVVCMWTDVFTHSRRGSVVEEHTDEIIYCTVL